MDFGTIVIVIVIAVVLIAILVIGMALYAQAQGPAAMLEARAELEADRAERDRAREQNRICVNWRPAHGSCEYRPRGEVGWIWRPISFLAHNGIELLVVGAIVAIVALLVTHLR